MVFSSESCSRKIDSLGRVVIPKAIRDRLDIRDGDELEIYTLEDDRGDRYVCFGTHRDLFNKYVACAEVLHELKLKLPESLKERIAATRVHNSKEGKG